MSFEARYFGECGSCEENIEPGESVEYRDGWICHTDRGPVVIEAPARVCPSCWLEIPRGGSCGCED